MFKRRYEILDSENNVIASDMILEVALKLLKVLLEDVYDKKAYKILEICADC